MLESFSTTIQKQAQEALRHQWYALQQSTQVQEHAHQREMEFAVQSERALNYTQHRQQLMHCENMMQHMSKDMTVRENQVCQAAELYRQAATEQMTQQVTEEREQMWHQEEMALAKERHRHSELTEQYQACLREYENSANQEVDTLRQVLQQGHNAHATLQNEMQAERDRRVREETTLRHELAELHKQNQDLQLQQEERAKAEKVYEEMEMSIRQQKMAQSTVPPHQHLPQKPVGPLTMPPASQRQEERQQMGTSMPPPPPQIRSMNNQFTEVTRFKEKETLIFDSWPSVKNIYFMENKL